MSPASRLGRGLAATLLVACTPCGASAAGADPFEAIARTFAKSSVEKGAAVGVALGIVVGAQPPRFFSYGVADKDSGEPFGPDVAFEIGSVTKVFTTNLLGQAIY
jgi:beta-lactamase class C